MVNANISPAERANDTNHQYTSQIRKLITAATKCEHKDCENPKSNERYCTLHMEI